MANIFEAKVFVHFSLTRRLPLGIEIDVGRNKASDVLGTSRLKLSLGTLLVLHYSQ